MTSHVSPVHPLAELHASIDRYYTQKISTHGATAPGVDWTCVPTQELRFVQLLKVCDFSDPFSLNDVGCGYGALLGFLRRRHHRCTVDYLGLDLSAAMILEAQRLWRRHHRAAFVVGGVSPRIADYSVASGIFNVKEDHAPALWIRHIEDTLRHMNATSRRGFAVNFLAPISGEMDPKPGLYRVDPEFWLEHCARAFNLKAELAPSYGMREFTLIVRR